MNKINIFKELEKNKEVLSDWNYSMEVEAEYKYIGITYDNINVLDLDLDFDLEAGEVKLEIKNAEKNEIEIMEVLNYKILEYINDVHTIFTSDNNNASITIYTI